VNAGVIKLTQIGRYFPGFVPQLDLAMNIRIFRALLLGARYLVQQLFMWTWLCSIDVNDTALRDLDPDRNGVQRG